MADSSRKLILPIEKANAYVHEGRLASDLWREESWRDQEMYDGAQWDSEEARHAKELGIEPITINRTFPAVNLILGSQEINQANIIAKARTNEDGTTSDLMSEAIEFVLDQNEGKFLIQQAFKDAVIPGIGWLYTGFRSDPRKEKISIEYRDWKEVYFDPYASPWIESNRCRYVFFQRWMDLFDLQCMYPQREKELADAIGQLMPDGTLSSSANFDAATEIEMDKRMHSSTLWWDPERRRIRPVQLWYPVLQPAVFAVFEDGGCVELTEQMSPRTTYAVTQSAQQIIRTSVRKLRVKTFVGNYELEDRPSPFNHNEYPFIPFVGYLDRYGFPFGVPRMIRGQDIEVNKRRSMNLALLTKRRVLMEEGASARPDKAFEEINKIDGFVMLQPGGLAKTQVLEGTQLSEYQIRILEQSEKEIQQVSGVNAEATGYQSNAQSGRAIELRRQQSSTIMASVFGNYRRSLHRLGKILVSNVQAAWTAPKVLRVTDKMTQAEKYITLNQRVLKDGSVIEIKNDITQGIYDIVISDSPSTDTVREQNMNLLIEWVKQAPHELIPYLMGMAMEMSNLPNKDQLMMKLRPFMGITPEEMDLSIEELQAKMQQEMQAKAAEEQAAMELKRQADAAALQRMFLENAKLEAEISKAAAQAQNIGREQDRKDFETGVDAGEKIRAARKEDVALNMAQQAMDIIRGASAPATPASVEPMIPAPPMHIPYGAYKRR